MQNSIKVVQKLEFRIPAHPVFVQTTTGQTIKIEEMNEENINSIFDAMKENALEFRRSKIEVATKLDSPEGKIASAAGKVLANKIG